MGEVDPIPGGVASVLVDMRQVTSITLKNGDT